MLVQQVALQHHILGWIPPHTQCFRDRLRIDHDPDQGKVTEDE